MFLTLSRLVTSAAPFPVNGSTQPITRVQPTTSTIFEMLMGGVVWVEVQVINSLTIESLHSLVLQVTVFVLRLPMWLDFRVALLSTCAMM